ncbi:MAG: hypothetical protein FWE41_02620, partial [Coriobacteriia bacterium]|nr:hypothetical protein [Coriobacteriia bacterium]
MPKNKQKKKKTGVSRSNYEVRNAQNKKASEKNTTQYIVRWIIIILLVFALAGSLFFGIVSSAYSLPSPEARTLTLHEQRVGHPYLKEYLQHPQLQPGDRIDGRPAEDYERLTDDLPVVQAPIAALCTRDGRILFERNIDEQVAMASTTKMMTAIIALESLPLETPLVVTYGAANTGGTSAGLAAGMRITLLDCLYALMLPSGNDASVVIAENIAGMESRFVALMNEKAQELGMTSTLYADSSGLSSDGHYSTARDYLVLAQYCMRNPTFRQIVGTGTHEANAGGHILNFITTDALSFYLKDATAIGIKTGYTDEAGYCFVG